MSLIVNEFSQILHRLVVICPTQGELRDLFEALSFELTTHPKMEKKKLELAGASLGGDHMQTWLSFTLGQRSKLNMRISLAGFSADRELPPPALLNFCEGIWLHVPSDNEHMERLFELKLSNETRQTPLLCTGFDSMPSDLRKRALIEFVKRNFSKYLSLKSGQGFLAEGLEWYLIH